MECDRVSVTINDDEIWEQRRARLKEIESVCGTHLQAESKYRMYLRLHPAVKKGNIDDFIEALKKCCAEERISLSNVINIQGPSQNSLLHIAAGIETADILRALEDVHDEQLNMTNYQGDTALHIAARAGRICTAELLLRWGIIVDKPNDAGNTALHEAVNNRHYELTRLLLNNGSRSVNKKNNENKCPLYLAVETGDSKILDLLMKLAKEHELPASQIEGMSPVHGAVIYRRIELLKKMSKQKKDLFKLQDAQSGTPLHLAASANYVEEVKFFVGEFAWYAHVDDEEGYLPIHVACKMGHLETFEVLLQHCLDPEEVLDLKKGQNILHIAAKYGMIKIVVNILFNPKLEKLINMKDKEGNTPLHVAILKLQNLVLTFLILQDVVELQLMNNGNLTALDIADEQRKKVDGLRERLIYSSLVIVGARRSVYKAIFQPKGLDPIKDLEPRHCDRLKDVANTRLVVATIIASMTFAAGFSVPGGYIDSGVDAGFAMLLNKPMYGVFVIGNNIALYSSIIAIAILHWADSSNWDDMVYVLSIARTPVVIALDAICVAFMAGIYLTISKCTWIAIVALIFGITALIVILSLHIVCSSGILFKLVRVEMSAAKRLMSFTRKSIKRRAIDITPGMPGRAFDILEGHEEPLPNVGGED
ncbi:hypothetical protein BT93_L0582 [Corymbia citriodora subsp. variegata]|uniref:PGG domain-containing protein n=1 Tax=Corymbia citriodora subsp. variegata TaxID=360336 RepID=A0A8T0CY24_CORYI|nr:hypothetical protein BT93_L0582 [Corymbia citriodora subsp. variegata]